MIRIRIKHLKRASLLSDALLKKIIKKTLQTQKIANGEINLVIAGDSLIKRLNRKYLNKKRATDVLAFSMREGRRLVSPNEIIGDVVISIDRAKIQAKIFRTTPKKELALYAIHGALHLLGHKDGSKKLESLQEKILKIFFR